MLLLLFVQISSFAPYCLLWCNLVLVDDRFLTGEFSAFSQMVSMLFSRLLGSMGIHICTIAMHVFVHIR